MKYLSFSMKNIVLFNSLLVFFILVVYIVSKKLEMKKYKEHIDFLDQKKEKASSLPLDGELDKVELIIKNEKMEEKFNSWQERERKLKEENLSLVSELLITLDRALANKDKAQYLEKVVEADFETYKYYNLSKKLLKEIKEINQSDEKYRIIITKLKAKYRKYLNKFKTNAADYKEFYDIIEMQFENIERRFQLFEDAMQEQEYTEVVHISKAIDTLVDHMSQIVDNYPDLILLGTQIIPKQIEKVLKRHNKMVQDGYYLKHLNIEYNTDESLKKVNDILDRLKTLDFEEAYFELSTMNEFFENVFVELDKEVFSKKEFDENKPNFELKLYQVNSVVSNLYKEIDNIKNQYDLKDEDLVELKNLKEKVMKVNDHYKELIFSLNKKEKSYFEVNNLLKLYQNELVILDDEADYVISNLGNFATDAKRAQDELKVINDLIEKTKKLVRTSNLPIIYPEYEVEIKEAMYASKQVEKELHKRPIVIEDLNLQVDTASILAVKVKSKVEDLVNDALEFEDLAVSLNKYRYDDLKLHERMKTCEKMFFKGEYNKALELLKSSIV